jgi:hypothetical protein
MKKYRILIHKGYSSFVSWDEHEEWWVGEVDKTGSEYVPFGGTDSTIEEAFEEAVNDYIRRNKKSTSSKVVYVISKTIGGLISAYITCQFIHYLAFGMFYY